MCAVSTCLLPCNDGDHFSGLLRCLARLRPSGCASPNTSSPATPPERFLGEDGKCRKKDRTIRHYHYHYHDNDVLSLDALEDTHVETIG